jgi:hypothetical protein
MNPVAALALLLLVGTALWGWRTPRPPASGMRRQTAAHYRRMYSRRNFLKLGVALGGAAALAYGGVDEAVESWHGRHVETATTDRITRVLHRFGERWWFGVWAGFALVDRFLGSTALSRWGRRNLQAMVVGLPTLWTVQRVLGGARPADHTHGPRFVPFSDDNSASGHCFLAAIPCLVAARHLRAPAPRALAYALSPVVGWSRIHDHKHYLSQVLLGYGIAWEAVAAVESVETRTPARADD